MKLLVEVAPHRVWNVRIERKQQKYTIKLATTTKELEMGYIVR